LLIFAATFAINSVNNLFILFPLYIVKLGGNATTIGAVIAMGPLAALLTRPLASVATEHYGCRLTAFFSIALDGVLITFYIQAHSLGGVLYLIRALQGVLSTVPRASPYLRWSTKSCRVSGRAKRWQRSA
jgi:MFS family permease